MPPMLFHKKLQQDISQLKKDIAKMESKLQDMEVISRKCPKLLGVNSCKANQCIKTCSKKGKAKSYAYKADGIEVKVNTNRKCIACDAKKLEKQSTKGTTEPQIKTVIRCRCPHFGPGDHIHQRIRVKEKSHVSQKERKPIEDLQQDDESNKTAKTDLTWGDILAKQSKEIETKSKSPLTGYREKKATTNEEMMRNEQKQTIKKLQRELMKKSELAAAQTEALLSLQKELMALQDERDSAKLEVKLKELSEEKLKVLLEGKQVNMHHFYTFTEAIEKKLKDELRNVEDATAIFARERQALNSKARELDLSVASTVRSVDNTNRTIRHRVVGDETTVHVTRTSRGSPRSETRFHLIDDVESLRLQGRAHSSPTPSELVPELPEIVDLSSIRDSNTFASI